MQFLRKGRREILNVAVYFVSNIFRRMLPFLLLPVITNYLPPEEYGIWLVYQVILNFSLAVIGMGIQNNISRSFFSRSRDEVALLIGNILLVLVINAAGSLLLLLAFTVMFGTFAGIPVNWLLLIVLISFANMIFEVDLTVLRHESKSLHYGIFQFSNAALNFTVTIVLVVLFAYGWEALAIGTLAGYIVFALAGLLRLWRADYLRVEFNRTYLREIYQICLPFIPHAIASVVIAMSDRIFIEAMLGTDVVGIYSVGYQLGMAVLLINESFSLAWSPWLFKQFTEMTERRRRQIVLFTYGFNLVMVLLAVGAAVASIFVIRWMINEAYAGAEIYVFWVSLAYVMRGAYTMVVPYLVQTGKTKFLGITSFTAGMLNLIANYLLIRQFGAIGGAYATILSYALMAGAVWWYASRVYPMPWGLSFLWRRSPNESAVGQ